MGKVEKGFIDVKRLARLLEDAWYHSMKARNGFLCWDGRFTKPITKSYKISLCSTCKDRLDDLKQTLPQNVKDNSDYPNVEFVVLDYNSVKDDVGGWIKSEMMEYVASGRLVYYRTEEPKFFDMSHAKNVVMLAASGDVVNSVDGDNFTPPSDYFKCGFANFINKLANEQPERAIFAKSRQLLRGRLGFWKREFIELGGYNEKLKGYGNEDANLQNRAWMCGHRMLSFRGQFCGIIPNHIKHRSGNYKEEWWRTEGKNRLISYTDLIVGNLTPNGCGWGEAKLIKNFDGEVVKTGIGIQG